MQHVVYLSCDAASLVFVWVHARMFSDVTVAFVVGEENAEQKVGLMWMWLTQIKAKYKSVCVLRGWSSEATNNVLPNSPILKPDRGNIRIVCEYPEHVYFLRPVHDSELIMGDCTRTTVFCEPERISPIKAANYVYMATELVAPLGDSDTMHMLATLMDPETEVPLKHVALLLGDDRAYVVESVFAHTTI